LCSFFLTPPLGLTKARPTNEGLGLLRLAAHELYFTTHDR
jgi:hypothetical protein